MLIWHRRDARTQGVWGRGERDGRGNGARTVARYSSSRPHAISPGGLLYSAPCRPRLGGFPARRPERQSCGAGDRRRAQSREEINRGSISGTPRATRCCGDSPAGSMSWSRIPDQATWSVGIRVSASGCGVPAPDLVLHHRLWADGPYAACSGHDLTYTAHSGLLNAINPDLPWYPQTVLAVPLGAMMAATGVAAALLERDRTEKGCQIDVSLAESATWLLAGSDGELADSAWGIPASPDRRLYECNDGRFVSVAAAEPRTWAALCGAGRPCGPRPTDAGTGP